MCFPILQLHLTLPNLVYNYLLEKYLSEEFTKETPYLRINFRVLLYFLN